MSTHIPAWKRLGLKLKYAKEEPDNTLTASSTNVREHDHDHLVSDRPVKRRRIVKNENIASAEQNGPHSSPGNPVQSQRSKESSTTNGSSQQPETSAVSLNHTIQRKKSVTFSEETKQEDGDSRTTIDFPAGSPGSTPKKTKKLSTNERSESPKTTIANNDVDSPTANHETTPTKKQPKPKIGKKSKSSTKDKSSSALDYLTQHRSTRDSWKFNKIIDVWILNHALDVQAIPLTYVPALAGYVRGLPAKAGSRDRLVKECKEALSSSQVNGDTNEEDRSLFIHFVESQDGSLEDETRLKEFLAAHSRAAVLLWSLDETVGGAPVKKKKSRTSAPIDISSSSESDSDSDSSDESSESEGESKVKSDRSPKVIVNGLSSKDDTSSSGTSSSEEDDDTSSSEGSSDSSSDEEDD